MTKLLSTVEQPYCNDRVLEILAGQMELARKWGAQGITCILARSPGETIGISGGMMGLEHAMRLEMRQVDKKLLEILIDRTPPEQRVDPGADYLCFNCATGPFNFDFITWLVEGEMTRRRLGAPGPLKVGFWMGRNGHSNWLDEPYFKQIYENVMRPALALVEAVEDPDCRGRFHDNNLPIGIIKAALAGEQVPRLRSPLWPAMRDTAPVTITLRETSLWPDRNSNVPAWLFFAEELKKQGHHVIVIRDTAMADEPLDGLETCPRASRELHYRVALYQSAVANLFVANGPAHLAMFTDVPYLIFNGHTQPDGHPYWSDTPTFWREKVGIPVGGQWPWATPRQQMIWEPDTLENIERGWHNLWRAPAQRAQQTKGQQEEVT